MLHSQCVSRNLFFHEAQSISEKQFSTPSARASYKPHVHPSALTHHVCVSSLLLALAQESAVKKKVIGFRTKVGTCSFFQLCIVEVYQHADARLEPRTKGSESPAQGTKLRQESHRWLKSQPRQPTAELLNTSTTTHFSHHTLGPPTTLELIWVDKLELFICKCQNIF